MRLQLVAPLLAAVLLLTGCTEAGPQSGSADTLSDTQQWRQPTTEPVTFSGPTVDGGTFDSKRYRGRVVVVNFWYAGCGPCRAEAPTLQSLSSSFPADDVQFVGVNVSDDAALAKNFERDFAIGFPSIVDQQQGAAAQLAFASALPPKAIPSTIVLDAKGRVSARIVGLANRSILRQYIQDAVDGAAA